MPKYTHTRRNDTEFDISEAKGIKESQYLSDKPFGCLWLSVNNGWEDWCLHNEPIWVRNHSRTEIRLENDTKILDASNSEELKKYIKTYSEPFSSYKKDYIDFIEVSKDYDGFRYNPDTCDKYHRLFYSWDCDSIALFNLDKVKDFAPMKPLVFNLDDNFKDYYETVSEFEDTKDDPELQKQLADISGAPMINEVSKQIYEERKQLIEKDRKLEVDQDKTIGKKKEPEPSFGNGLF